MSNNTHWSADDLKKKGLIQVNGIFVKASSQAAKKVVKISHEDVIKKLQSNISPTDVALKNPYAKVEPAENKKVRNATKSVNADGVKFDSNLERYMYDLLTGAKVHFEFQKVFELLPKFKYRDENIQSIKKVVDFYLPTRNIIIDTKGFSNDVSPMKHKMLKSVLKHLHDMQPEILMPKNKPECDAILNRLLYQK